MESTASRQFAAFLKARPEQERYLVAFSGGLDSTVLLHLCAQSIPSQRLRTIHIDHGIQLQSKAWAEHCRKVCDSLGVELHVIEVQVDSQSADGPESAARNARYSALEAKLWDNEVLLTAHHQEDQSETLLIQLLRGSGPKGLAAMPTSRPFGRGVHARPLLALSRAELLEFAQEQGLEWIDDPSNLDRRYTRNFLRHEVLPPIRQRWPAVDDCLSRAARHQAAAVQLLDELAAIDLREHTGPRNTLVLAGLAGLNEPRQLNLLRYWLQSSGLPVPSESVLKRIPSELIPAAEDGSPCVSWPGAEVRRFSGRLYADVPLSTLDPDWRQAWDGKSELPLPAGLGSLALAPQQGGLDPALLDSAGITIRFRLGGERCRARPDAQSRPLKKLFQEWGVEPWRRGRIPLLFAGDELVAVAGYWQGGIDCVPDDQTGLKLIWNHHEED
ncbi:MAG: tRNA lysidine(34) synthetase TilS [Gammaproteobacteria bacterium]